MEQNHTRIRSVPTVIEVPTPRPQQHTPRFNVTLTYPGSGDIPVVGDLAISKDGDEVIILCTDTLDPEHYQHSLTEPQVGVLQVARWRAIVAEVETLPKDSKTKTVYAYLDAQKEWRYNLPLICYYQALKNFTLKKRSPLAHIPRARPVIQARVRTVFIPPQTPTPTRTRTALCFKPTTA